LTTVASSSDRFAATFGEHTGHAYTEPQVTSPEYPAIRVEEEGAPSADRLLILSVGPPVPV
jgi:hypothetical protein